MKLILDDNGRSLNFAPFTLTRPVGELRIGIFTNSERWQTLLPEVQISYKTQDYLQDKYNLDINGVTINACIIPNKQIAEAVRNIKPNETIRFDGGWIAKEGMGEVYVNYEGDTPIELKERWELYQQNEIVLAQDFALITAGRQSETLSDSNTVVGDSGRIFVEKGARIEAAILSPGNGYMYFGRDTEVMEGAMIRGSLAMCEGSVLKLGAKIYGSTTLGPHCKVGGEVNNVIFTAYSNKGHDGFLGNSVIGEWCNIGADTNTSNLKNNYSAVKTYNYNTGKLEQTDIQFMGLMMGDHSKCGINTMFNTATVVGVMSNIFGAGFPTKYLSNFQWGTSGEKFAFDKAVESATNMMSRRGLQLSDNDLAILKHISDNL
jgi:UDP-N-acetylglucosamine diphosphorylase/glucosamine-1-phosphate N-acetyltransferase